MESFEKPLREREIETEKIAERFGDSLTVFGETESVREHLKHLEKLPSELIRVMREKGLKVMVGEGNIIDMMSNIPGIKAFVLRLVEKFLAKEREVETSIGGWQRTEKRRTPIPLGVYAAALRIVFVGGHTKREYQAISSSLVLHEYGHGLGHLLKLDGSKTLREAHLRLYPKLISYLQQGKAGGFAGKKELLAESFAGYIDLSKEQFISRYDEQLYSFWEETIANIEDYSEL